MVILFLLEKLMKVAIFFFKLKFKMKIKTYDSAMSSFTLLSFRTSSAFATLLMEEISYIPVSVFNYFW